MFTQDSSGATLNHFGLLWQWGSGGKFSLGCYMAGFSALSMVVVGGIVEADYPSKNHLKLYLSIIYVFFAG